MGNSNLILVKPKRESISPRTRFRILERDRFACQYCGGAAPHVRLVIDHGVPVVEGGDNSDFNLITACEECNQGKHARMIWRLLLRDLIWKHINTVDSYRERFGIDGQWVKQYLEAEILPIRHWIGTDMTYLLSRLLQLADAVVPDRTLNVISPLRAAIVLKCLGLGANIIVTVALREAPPTQEEFERCVQSPWMRCHVDRLLGEAANQ